jgi:hypothetical protein
MVAERTAAVIWSVLERVQMPIFLWNVFPFHPHEPENPFSNRAHKSYERKAGEELLASLLGLLRPRRIIAIGNDAASAASRVCGEMEVLQVRHPSYGGQPEFLQQTTRLYELGSQTLV